MRTNRLYRLLVVLVATAAWVATAPAATDFAWGRMSGPWIDQDRLLGAHAHRKAEVGPEWEYGWRPALEHLLWPEDATIAKLRVSPERTARARADCVRELKRVLRPEHVPAGLADRLLGIAGYGETNSDFLFGRYKVGPQYIQVVYSGHATGILVVPEHPPRPPAATADYALRVAKTVFVPLPRHLDPYVKAGAIIVDGIAHGGYGNSHPNGADALVGPSPWYGATFITDGKYVFLEPTKWGLREGVDIRFSATPPKGPPRDQQIKLFD